MKEDRISVFGRDAEGNEKRGFDCLLINGKPYIESINKEGHKIKTPASSAADAFIKLQQQQQA